MKYRYMMGGSFRPQNMEYLKDDIVLMIDVPCPYARDTEEEARKDSCYAYRFGFDGEHGVDSVTGEPVILVFPGSNWEGKEDNDGNKYIIERTEGSPVASITYDEFKSNGGIIYTAPPGMVWPPAGVDINSFTEEEIIEGMKKWTEETKDAKWDSKDYEVHATFKELFPAFDIGMKPVYIDDESYCIQATEE